MRSWLFVPGDSARKIAKAGDSGADVLILDLEDSVAPAQKPTARDLVREALTGLPRPIAVRINPLTGEDWSRDLEAIVPGAPDIIVLPKSQSGRDIGALSAALSVAEAKCGLQDGVTKIMAIATETAAAMFGLGTYAGASQRLTGLAWGMEDLSAAIGATRTRTQVGALTPQFAVARSLCLFGAHAAGVAPIDTVHTAIEDREGLIAEARNAAADGFTGKMAIHPAQVDPINAAFTPTPQQIEHAQAIVAAFADESDAGVLSVDGQMVDRPHLIAAQNLLKRAQAAGATA